MFGGRSVWHLTKSSSILGVSSYTLITQTFYEAFFWKHKHSLFGVDIKQLLEHDINLYTPLLDEHARTYYSKCKDQQLS